MSEYVSQPLWAGKASRTPFPFQSFHWVNYTGHIPSLCTRLYLQNGNNISSLFCKVFWDLLMEKKTQTKKNPPHTKLLSSFEFHENSACKLCSSVILGTPCSWLQYYYSTWSRWTQIITRFLHNFSDFFFTNRSQNILQKRQLMLFPITGSFHAVLTFE